VPQGDNANYVRFRNTTILTTPWPANAKAATSLASAARARLAGMRELSAKVRGHTLTASGPWGRPRGQVTPLSAGPMLPDWTPVKGGQGTWGEFTQVPVESGTAKGR
jgi:hypothetical protein